MSALLLRLAGPTQAWDSRRRLSEYDGHHGGYGYLGPTWTGVVGLLGAALGRPRGADLGALADVDVIVRADQPGRPRGDFHTTRRVSSGRVVVQGVVERVVDDAVFLVGVGAPDLVLDEIEAALRRPVYPLSLGKREYPVTLPLVVGRSELPVVDAVTGWPSIAGDWYVRPAVDGEPRVYRVLPRRRWEDATVLLSGGPVFAPLSRG